VSRLQQNDARMNNLQGEKEYEIEMHKKESICSTTEVVA
jgi:hypothetical protein